MASADGDISMASGWVHLGQSPFCLHLQLQVLSSLCTESTESPLKSSTIAVQMFSVGGGSVCSEDHSSRAVWIPLFSLLEGTLNLCSRLAVGCRGWPMGAK